MERGIIILSSDKDPEFKWMTNGWYSIDNRNYENTKFFNIAEKCISDGNDFYDVIEHLKKEGFEVYY